MNYQILFTNDGVEIKLWFNLLCIENIVPIEFVNKVK